MWGICGLLTVFDIVEGGARVDIKIKILRDAPWLRLPYPGMGSTYPC